MPYNPFSKPVFPTQPSTEPTKDRKHERFSSPRVCPLRSGPYDHQIILTLQLECSWEPFQSLACRRRRSLRHHFPLTLASVSYFLSQMRLTALSTLFLSCLPLLERPRRGLMASSCSGVWRATGRLPSRKRMCLSSMDQLQIGFTAQGRLIQRRNHTL